MPTAGLFGDGRLFFRFLFLLLLFRGWFLNVFNILVNVLGNLLTRSSRLVSRLLQLAVDHLFLLFQKLLDGCCRHGTLLTPFLDAFFLLPHIFVRRKILALLSIVRKTALQSLFVGFRVQLTHCAKTPRNGKTTSNVTQIYALSQ